MTDTLAAIDLGSNSFHLVVARITPQGVQITHRLKEKVQLALGLDDNKQLDDAAIERGLACLTRFADSLGHLSSVKLKAVGTSSLRQARNGQQFIRQAEEILNQRIHIISGKEEARLIFQGVAQTRPLDKSCLIIDIGGGSTELAFGQEANPSLTDSLPLGCLNFYKRFFSDHIATQAAFDKAVRSAEVELINISNHYRESTADEVLGTSGTINAIHDILVEHGYHDGIITLPRLEELAEHIIEQGDLENLQLAGASDYRRPYIICGIAILTALFKQLRLRQLSACESALREGIVYELLDDLGHYALCEDTVKNLLHRFNSDLRHANQVQKTALKFFDQIAKDWQLEQKDYRLLLSYAALLHEVGLSINYDQYHKHSAYIVEMGDLPGFTFYEQKQMSLLVRSQRKKLKLDLFDELMEKDKIAGIRMTRLLRIACIIHHNRRMHDYGSIHLETQGETLIVNFAESWLDDKPVIKAEFEREQEYCEQANFILELQ